MLDLYKITVTTFSSGNVAITKQNTNIFVKCLCKAFHNFFKEAKQLLGLRRCQSKDFDAQVADTTITMIQHMMLTQKHRFEHDETKGVLFNHVREWIIQSRLDKRLWGLFIELLRRIEVLFDGLDEMKKAA